MEGERYFEVLSISFVSRARQGRLWLRSVESIPAATCNINIYVPGLYYCGLQIDVWRKYVSLLQEKKKRYRISIAIVIGKKIPSLSIIRKSAVVMDWIVSIKFSSSSGAKLSAPLTKRIHRMIKQRMQTGITSPPVSHTFRYIPLWLCLTFNKYITVYHT